MEIFVDRERELEALERCWLERPCFVVVYGRRRIGKTRLVKEFLKGRKHVYFFAQLTNHRDNLRRLASAVADALGFEELKSMEFESLDKLLTLVARFEKDLVVVLDEFSYWVRVAPRVLSELQLFVDEVLPNTKMMLVVVGSVYTVMVKEILSGGSPLYGRAKAKLLVKELDPLYIKEFVPRYSPEDRVRIYALFGGVPYYLRLIDDRKSLRENVKDLILAPYAPLRYEKDFVLREEFRDVHTYNAILSAIAKGFDTPSRIADVLGLDRGYVAKCLYILEELNIVSREVPLFSRRALRYVISDPILRTWYNIVEPVLHLLELELVDEALEIVMRRLDNYVAKVFEELVRRILFQIYAKQGFTEVGRVVHRGEEIDIVFLDPERRRAIAVEVKWSDVKYEEALRELRKLQNKAFRLLSGYTIEKTMLVVRSVEDSKPSDVLTVRDLGI